MWLLEVKPGHSNSLNLGWELIMSKRFATGKKSEESGKIYERVMIDVLWCFFSENWGA